MRAAIFIALCGSFLVNATPLSPPIVGGSGAPKYLSIKDVNKCLGSKNQGSFSTVCVPESKPAECCEQSWKELNALQGADKVECCKPAPPPKYTDVKDYDKCIRDNPAKKGTKCLLLPRPSACCEDSWNKLKALSGDDKLTFCPVVDPIGSNPVLPPKYLDVKDWKLCTGHIKKGSTSFVCLPKAKPATCCDASWKSLNELTGKEKLDCCEESPVPPPVITNPVLPPKYLGVKDWKLCTGENKKGSASFVCLPKAKPAACCDASWKSLSELTGKDKLDCCEESPAPPPAITNPVLPPKYLGVKDWKLCTGENKKGSASFVCLPKAKPAACCDASWKSLSELTGKDKLDCCEESPAPPPVITNPALPPKYLGVKDFDKCLKTCPTGTSTSWCLPDKKPAECCDQSWGQLSGFTGADKVPACKN